MVLNIGKYRYLFLKGQKNPLLSSACAGNTSRLLYEAYGFVCIREGIVGEIRMLLLCVFLLVVMGKVLLL